MKTLCALDLETTGLDPERDAVIEIGVVRFRGDRVEDEFQTLVNPGRPLTPFITELTGITDAMLANAPRIHAVLPELESFIGDLPVLGHNISFDLSFLQPHGLLKSNPSLDTYDLASVVLPDAGRYGLSALASQLGVPVKDKHRALEDAQATRGVLLRLQERVAELPYWLIQEIVQLGAELDWGAGWIFERALARREAEGLTDGKEPGDLFRGVPIPPREAESLEPDPEPEPLDGEALAGIIEPGGEFADRFSDYEHRSQQVQMLLAVSEALSYSGHLLVEAGTGTGKSMAYLIPAFHWADSTGNRLVISTNTINLQDQLIKKDIPDLADILDKPIRASVLKGRSNYLCPRQLNALRQVGPRSDDEMRVLAKVLVWMHSGGSGDRGEINLRRSGEAIAWSRLSADNEGCGGDTCRVEAGGRCPYHSARRRAETAHLIIVNHALLLADIATGSRVIPEYDYLIVDEAHHLEDATTSGLSFRVTEAGVYRLLRDIGDADSGLLGQLTQVARRQLPPDVAGQVDQAVNLVTKRIDESRSGIQRFFGALDDFLAIRRDGKSVGPYGQQERIVGSTRMLPEWSDLEIAWDNLKGPFRSMLDALEDLEASLLGLAEQGVEEAENLALNVRTVARGLSEVYANLDHMIFDPDPMTIYWAEASSSRERPSLHAAPLEVGQLVRQHIWHEKESVIMTSATLTTGGSFDYLRRRLGAEDADELALGSPFDYESATLLYLVNDIPEPSAGAPYQRAVEKGLIQLCKATYGRTLALFTSYSQLRRTAKAISGPLAAEGILVYEQGEGASRHALLETFREADQAVLLGTRSFWEGVDVPGQALSVLAIIRLPFDVPSDPIIAARSEMYEAPFNQYTVPEAVLRFRQGFGRLIRTRADRGVVVTFDRRLVSKYYGQAFVDSLPRCTVRSGRLAQAPEA
ncbi:MAG: helicase C-terminal domain-containing protein, partial [Anaerolineales bacterium]|nr:helicase C-terminal domain-containing protein [Anaerolineales bacterium]